MEGFGVHTFRLVNKDGHSTFVKFHWKPKLGLQSVLWDEALKINGADPDFHRRDLQQAIANGDFPQWELGVQLFDEKFVESFPFDVLDSTKIIPEEDVPVRIVGRMVLNKLVDNHFAETEQVAFCTANVVPGIDFTNDPLLQGRNFSYLDTQLTRLGGPNFNQLPVNAPKCPLNTLLQNGFMRHNNLRGRANYEPNSWGQGPRECPETGFKSFEESGHTTDKLRVRPDLFADHYSQARQFWVSQTAVEQQHIVDAFVFELAKAEEDRIQARMVSNLRNVDDQLAQRVAQGLGIELPAASKPAKAPITDLAPSKALSIVRNGPDSFSGRKLGILITDDADVELLDAMKAAIKKEGGLVEIIAPKTTVALPEKKQIEADYIISAGPSVLFDAVAIICGTTGAKFLSKFPPGRQFVNDAFAHCKFIAFAPEALAVFKAVGLADDLDEGCVEIKGTHEISKFTSQLKLVRYWPRQAMLTPEVILKGEERHSKVHIPFGERQSLNVR